MPSIALNTALNNYAAALGHIDQLDKLVEQAMGDLRGLKDGTKSLDDLVITEKGWEFKPRSGVNGKDSADAVKMTKPLAAV
jgi:hypothetical protein